MTLQELLQIFSEHAIGVDVTDGKISGLSFGPASTLTDGEAWDLVDTAGLRYIPPDEPPPPDWNVFYSLLEGSEVEAAIAAGAVTSPTAHLAFVKLAIEFSRRIDGTLSIDRLVKYWNDAVLAGTLTSDQRVTLNAWANQSYLPILCNEFDKLETL